VKNIGKTETIVSVFFVIMFRIMEDTVFLGNSCTTCNWCVN